jgi:DNA-binding CsgD family transcriptional regulator
MSSRHAATLPLCMRRASVGTRPGSACSRPRRSRSSRTTSGPKRSTARRWTCPGPPPGRSTQPASTCCWASTCIGSTRDAGRGPLTQAHDTFRRLGAHPWTTRAAAALRAAGSPTAAFTVPVTLSAQELEIAQLAASGLTNKQIGDRLYLSHRTIGAHLYRIFPKLASPLARPCGTRWTRRIQLKSRLTDARAPVPCPHTPSRSWTAPRSAP